MSTTSLYQINISNLPDLCLLLVFDHLPLLDLFNRIPLVCPRWTALQHSALARRTKLHLLSNEMKVGYPLSDILYFHRAVIYQEYRLDDHGHNEEDAALIGIDLLPLPQTYYGWTSGTGGRLLRPQAVEWLMHKLPNITELTIMPYFDECNYDVDGEDCKKYNHLSDTFREQAIRAITSGRWTSRLTILRAPLWAYNNDDQYTSSDDQLADELIEAINHRMPRLTELYLSELPYENSVLLSGDTLARLRLLYIRDDFSGWVWRSLCSAVVGTKLRPDLSIVIPFLRNTYPLVTQLPPEPTVLDHIQVLFLYPLFCLNYDQNFLLRVISQQFRSLRWLFLATHDEFDGNDPNCLLSTTMRRLTPLTSLAVLKLWNIYLLPEVVDDEQNESDTNDLDQVVLPSLQYLMMQTCGMRSHTDIGNALDWTHCLPSVKWVSISGIGVNARCVDCHDNNQSVVHSDLSSGELVEREFFTKPECRRLAVEPLQACPQLTEVQLDSQTAIRCDLSAPFQWQ